LVGAAVTLEQMQGHIVSLSEANEIACWFGAGPDEAWGSYWLREIEIPSIKDQCSRATALQEVGHILGRHPLSEVILVRERWAWRWARRNALEWTPAMQRHSQWCLECYQRNPKARSSVQIEMGSE
jgi:hypothetical protein